ncbi:MAG: hypothetical protein V4451_16175 [Pseudomonadota bacterium]
MVKKQTFIHITQALAAGLCESIRTDQVVAAHLDSRRFLAGGLGAPDLARFKTNGNLKASGVGLQSTTRFVFNEDLPGCRDAVCLLPVADRALVATQPSRSFCLRSAVISDNLIWGHDHIMAVAIWHLP